MTIGLIKSIKLNYVISVVIYIAGTVISCLFILKNVQNDEDRFYRMIAPGEHKIYLRNPGNYTLFYEYKSIIGSRVFSSNPDILPNLKFILTDISGKEIRLSPAVGNESYSSSKGFSGVSLFKFKIIKDGEYILKTNHENSEEKNQIVLAITEGFTRRFLYLFGITGVIMLITITLSGYIAYRTYKKSRSLKSLPAESGQV